jgi:hypothetical protein
VTVTVGDQTLIATQVVVSANNYGNAFDSAIEVGQVVIP